MSALSSVPSELLEDGPSSPTDPVLPVVEANVADDESTLPAVGVGVTGDKPISPAFEFSVKPCGPVLLCENSTLVACSSSPLASLAFGLGADFHKSGSSPTYRLSRSM